MSQDELGKGAARGSFDYIPLVDVGGLFSDDLEARRQVARGLDRAARTAGFLYVKNHGMAPELVLRLEAAAKRFFGAPEEHKLRYYIGLSRNHRGYVPPGEEVFYGQSKDLKEAFDLALDLPSDDPDYRAGNRLLGPNVGPTCPTSRPTSRHITTPRSTSGAGSSAASPWRSICPKIGSTRT